MPGSRALVGWLDRAVLWVTVPALILARLPDLALGADLVVPAAAAWGALALAATSVLVGSRRCGWDRRTTGALLLVTPLGNTTFLGLPMVESLLGSEAVPSALAFDQLGNFVALVTYGSVIAARYGTGEPGWRPVVANLVRFPPFFAVVASFALRAWPLPEGLDDALGDVGRLVAPLAMLALGLRFQVVVSRAGRQAAVWCLVTALLLMPAAVAAAGWLDGGLDDPAWQASVLEAGMPPMVTAGVVAASADLDGDLATTVVGVGLVLALVTIPAWALLLG